MINKKHEKPWTVLNHIERFIILVSAVNGCNSDSAIASLLGIPTRIANSAIRSKICSIAGWN